MSSKAIVSPNDAHRHDVIKLVVRCGTASKATSVLKTHPRFSGPMGVFSKLSSQHDTYVLINFVRLRDVVVFPSSPHHGQVGSELAVQHVRKKI